MVIDLPIHFMGHDIHWPFIGHIHKSLYKISYDLLNMDFFEQLWFEFTRRHILHYVIGCLVLFTYFSKILSWWDKKPYIRSIFGVINFLYNVKCDFFFLKEQNLPFFGGIYLNSLANVCGGSSMTNTFKRLEFFSLPPHPLETYTQFKTSMDDVHEKSTFYIYVIGVLDL